MLFLRNFTNFFGQMIDSAIIKKVYSIVKISIPIITVGKSTILRLPPQKLVFQIFSKNMRFFFKNVVSSEMFISSKRRHFRLNKCKKSHRKVFLQEKLSFLQVFRIF